MGIGILHTQLLSISMDNGMRTPSYCINIVVIHSLIYSHIKLNLNNGNINHQSKKRGVHQWFVGRLKEVNGLAEEQELPQSQVVCEKKKKLR